MGPIWKCPAAHPSPIVNDVADVIGCTCSVISTNLCSLLYAMVRVKVQIILLLLSGMGGS